MTTTAEYPAAFLALLVPGRAVRLDYGIDNRLNCLRHIRAIVDDEQVVYRVWNAKNGWQYFVSDRYSFYWRWTKGYLTKARG